MIKAVVAGASGRMGKRLIALLRESPDFQVIRAVERRDHVDVGRDAGEVAGVGPLGGPTVDTLPGAQVVLDFTAPAAAMQNLEAASQAGVAMVVGTTGLSAADLKRARELTGKIPCVQSPNMSVGVNVLYGVLAQVARTLGDGYDIEVIEAHHHFKKDSPSGTADRMAHVLADALGRDLRKVGVYGRHGMVGERTKEEIGVHAIRAGDIVGEHTILFGGMGERIEITHRAHSRDNFAFGALRAARWVVGKPSGLYDMLDVLGLKLRA
ncbi:MAG: 4-hydroxy-tetrahydrodipicolinate reductase [candidate division NC10 bacterium]|nr:4-hydroxy-tetrahydrodipicolinate reductase [candidate division NC10 bacterium]